MNFEYMCEWELGKKLVTLDNFHHEPEQDCKNYGFDIYMALKNSHVGDIVNWNEPFNGWVVVKRIS